MMLSASRLYIVGCWTGTQIMNCGRFGRKQSWPDESTLLVLVCLEKTEESLKNTSVRIAIAPAVIQTKCLSHTSPENYHIATMLNKVSVGSGIP
jgi:hypothetical protein